MKVLQHTSNRLWYFTHSPWQVASSFTSTTKAEYYEKSRFVLAMFQVSVSLCLLRTPLLSRARHTRHSTHSVWQTTFQNKRRIQHEKKKKFAPRWPRNRGRAKVAGVTGSPCRFNHPFVLLHSFDVIYRGYLIWLFLTLAYSLHPSFILYFGVLSFPFFSSRLLFWYDITHTSSSFLAPSVKLIFLFFSSDKAILLLLVSFHLFFHTQKSFLPFFIF